MRDREAASAYQFCQDRTSSLPPFRRLRLSTAPGFRLEGYVDFGVAARRRGSNSGDDAIGEPPNERPAGAACQNHESNAARLQVLLMPDPPVGCDQHLEAALFRDIQQRTVAERVPPSGLGRVNRGCVSAGASPFGVP